MCEDANRESEVRVGRRGVLRGLGGMAAVGAFGAGGALGALGRLVAQERPAARRVILCEFNGAWDPLMHVDARDPARSFPGINLGTDLLPAEYQDPIPITVGGTRTLWGAPMAALRPHADVTTVFRGINMSTVSHPTGQAYMNTGLLPSGSNARGSSLGTVFAAGGDLSARGPILPFVSIGIRTYNDRYPREASALRLARSTDLGAMLSTYDRPLPTAVEALLGAARADARSCIGPSYAGDDPSLEQQISRERLARLTADGFASRFDFNAMTPEMESLRTLYGFERGAAEGTPAVRAATAARLVKSGLAQSVAVRIQSGLDTHADWANIQPQRLEAGFSAIAAMLNDLREDDPNLDRTTIVAFSDFGRTPRINGNQGRDHWFAGAAIVWGGLRPGVFGDTNPDDLGIVRVDETTGRRVMGEGLQLKPEHVAATLVTACGLDASAYRVEPIRALIPA